MAASSMTRSCEVCMKGWEDDFVPDDQFDPGMFAAFEQTYEPEDTVLVAPSEAEPSPGYKLHASSSSGADHATTTTTTTTNNNNLLSSSSISKPRRIWGQTCLHQLDLRELRDKLGKEATLQEVHDEVFRRLQLRREHMTPENFERMMDIDTTAFELKHIEGVPEAALEEAKFLVFLKWKEFSDNVKTEWDVVAEEEDWDDVKKEEGDEWKEKTEGADEEWFVSKFEELKVHKE